MAAFRAPKVVIIGLDGVPYGLIERYTAAGIMPNTLECVRRGRMIPMASSIPDVSSTAWSSAITGKNPGEHGIFGFIEADPLTYRFRFPGFKDLAAPPFWQGVKSAVLNIPQTYPAAIEGDSLMVSGFVALELEKAVAPQRWLEMVKEIGYRLDVESNLAATSIDAFMDDAEQTLAARMRLFESTWDKDGWELYYFVFSETDRVNHFLFEAWDAPSHRYHGRFTAFYRAVDTAIGAIVKRLDSATALYLHSDHGFCPLKHEVYVNHWLMKDGFLSFNTATPRSLQDMNFASKAFAMDPARIYIHTNDRFPNSKIPASGKEEIRTELMQSLKALRVDGRTPIARVLDGKDVFRGPHAEKGPDMVLIGERGFDLKSVLAPAAASGKRHFTGMHTQDDAFFIHAQPESEAMPDPFHIEQIARVVLDHLGK